VRGMGAKLVSLVHKPAAHDWLLGPADRPFRPVPYGASFVDQDMSGWDEMFPTIEACPYPGEGPYAGAALPDHGEDHQPESHLIPIVLKVALEQRENISIFGTDYPPPDGTNIRDYIHISDLVSAHLLVLDALSEREQLVYNLGNGTGYSVREVIETARRVTGKKIQEIITPRRPGDSPRLVASSKRIQRELGWKPQTPRLDDIIASAWEWHSTHPYGYGEEVD